MKTLTRAALLAAVAVLAASGPVQAAPVETKLFFHCGNTQGAPTPLKVQNTGATGFPFWNTTAPTTSYTAGGGCGTLDVPLGGTAPRNLYDAVFTGTYAGAIDKIRFELHSLILSQARNTPTSSLQVKITQGDSNALYKDSPPLADRAVVVTPEKSSTGATEVFKFTLNDLQIPAGPADRVLNLTIATAVPYANAWVFDATEIASNATFVAPDLVPGG